MSSFVNARYTKASAGGAKSARAALNYGLHREGDGSRDDPREGFGFEGKLEKSEILDRFDAFEGNLRDLGREAYYYSLILNPGDGRNEVDKVSYVQDVMFQLSQAHGDRGARLEWAGVVHDDQGNHDHAHVVLVTDKTLSKGELRELRDDAAPRAWEHAKESILALGDDLRINLESEREIELGRDFDLDERGR